MKRYVYYQPNEKDLKDEYGDCTIRALSKALGTDWLGAFNAQVKICRKYQCSNVFNLPLKQRKAAMDELGFTYGSISVKKGKKRPTVREFAQTHEVGAFIVHVAGHEVAVCGGQYFDTWDCGYKPIYNYFERTRIIV